MTKYSHLLRAILPCLLLTVAPLLPHCGEAASFGTETGNPPHIEQRKLYLELVDGGLRVVGTREAIAPSRAPVRVTNLATGTSVETTAGRDGSLDVVILAGADDELEVTVTSGGQETTERISFGAIGSRTDLRDLSCQALEATLDQTIRDVFSTADTACATDEDCLFVGYDTASPCAQGCGMGLVTRAGLELATSQGQQRTSTVCSALEACERPPHPICPLVAPAGPTCVNGRCEAAFPARQTCDDFIIPAAQRRTELRAAASKICTQDADCALAYIGVTCLNDCGRTMDAVARAAVDVLETRILDEVASAYCAPALNYGCEAPSDDCTPPVGTPRAVCDTGACGVLYE